MQRQHCPEQRISSSRQAHVPSFALISQFNGTYKKRGGRDDPKQTGSFQATVCTRCEVRKSFADSARLFSADDCGCAP
jgi:hypothetical protein